MSKELEALKLIKWKLEDEGILGKEYELCDIIEKALKEKEELKKAFDSLSKEEEKVMKLLSKEIEKNRALVIIKELFEFDFALRFPNNQPMLMITNKYGGSYFEIPISKDKYDLLKEALL